MDEHQVHILRIQNRDREDNNVRLYSTNTGVASRKIKNFPYVIVDAFGCRKKVLNPKSSFLQKWNMIFLLSCAISLLVDPVYLYTMIINRNRSCLDLDEKLAVVTTVLSSFVDVVNIIRIIFQFRTGYLASSSGISVLVEDNKKIVRRYLSSTFLIDIISVLPLPQVLGAFWYFFSIEREMACWRAACKIQIDCHSSLLYCDENLGDYKPLNASAFSEACPVDSQDSSPFNFGIYFDALNSDVVASESFLNKFFYCFWWALQNLSSLGQNLKTSTFIGEILFAVAIFVTGLILFTFVIGILQALLMSQSKRQDELKRTWQNIEEWMSDHYVPDNLKVRVRRHEQYKWQKTRGMDVDNLLQNLPRDLRRDMKRHLCLNALIKVPLFREMDGIMLDTICESLKLVLYTEESFIIREGDPIDEMIFVIRGNILSTKTEVGRIRVNTEYNFCGEELLPWALDPDSSTDLPISVRTVQAVSEVEAFALMADDLKLILSRYMQVSGNQLLHNLRFYSSRCRNQAAHVIQTAWRSYQRKKLRRPLGGTENPSQLLFDGDGRHPPSLGATVYASRFAANILGTLRRGGVRTRKYSSLLP
ncbi:hypothetical protein K2173_009911 [Erythroxylum novogranatense]|uniref:Cyclic nucleotide-binding domain-containing protein n=1 Tax=Erythroxylum novogranatense TaxID=1862640 RepID=A0AAV8T0N2_9ROSI|nr:hypothetical protein K2173_009911 [Erythroxylum novogranatense]